MKKNSKKELLENLRKTPVIEVACAKSNIGRTTFYRWKDEDPEFAKQAEEAMREGSAFITDAAVSQLINLIKKGNFHAAMAWLRAYHPDFKTRIEIEANIREDKELSEEKRKIYDEIISAYAIPKIQVNINNKENGINESTIE